MDPRPRNVATLWDIAGGSIDLFRELVDEYILTANDLVTNVRNALSAGDLRGSERAAHTLKGSSGMVGLALVQEACASVEKASREGRLDEARALLPALEQEHEATLAWLREQRDNPVPP
jgi:HPt (histidine-containing phosphotransfer) domain-containing protein